MRTIAQINRLRFLDGALALAGSLLLLAGTAMSAWEVAAGWTFVCVVSGAILILAATRVSRWVLGGSAGPDEEGRRAGRPLRRTHNR